MRMVLGFGVIISRRPPKLTVPTLVATVPVLGATTYVTVREPVPVAPFTIAIQSTSLRACHEQPVAAVTVSTSVLPAGTTVAVVTGNGSTHVATVMVSDASPAGPRGAVAVTVIVPISRAMAVAVRVVS